MGVVSIALDTAPFIKEGGEIDMLHNYDNKAFLYPPRHISNCCMDVS